VTLFRHWKIVLGLVLVFAAGAVTGSVFTHIATKRAFERGLKFENWTAAVMAHLEKKLNLTPDQKPKVREIVEDMGKQLQGAFSKTLEESGRIVVQSGKRIDQVLTDEQRAIHAKEKKQFRAGLKKVLNLDLPEE
jgi:hypothetical protein